jgi:hypothetical protein
MTYSPAWPHSPLQEIFPNIFFVTGTNITNYKGIDLQHSRNMVIVRRGSELSLINTVRLDEQRLTALDKLGKVNNIIRIGAFHGRDDAFYLDRYKATLWAIEGMTHADDRPTDSLLKPGEGMPFSGCSFLPFETSKFPEGVLLIKQDGGILVTCDSIKNWTAPDPYFSEATAALYQQQGFFGTASISNIWKQTTQVQASDFEKLLAMPFKHLLSAHGEPLRHQAHDRVAISVKEQWISGQ